MAHPPSTRPKFAKLPPPPTNQTGQVPDVRPEPPKEAVLPKASTTEPKTVKGKKRKKTLRIKQEIDRLMDDQAIGLDYEPVLHPVTKQPMTFEQAIALSMMVKSATGDKDATREVLDRMLGKAPQSLDVHQHGTIETTERVSDIARNSINAAADRAIATVGDGKSEVPRFRPGVDGPDNGPEGSQDSAS